MLDLDDVLQAIGSAPSVAMKQLHAAIKVLLERIATLNPRQVIYHGETIGVMELRWKKLYKGRSLYKCEFNHYNRVIRLL